MLTGIELSHALPCMLCCYVWKVPMKDPMAGTNGLEKLLKSDIVSETTSPHEPTLINARLIIVASLVFQCICLTGSGCIQSQKSLWATA